MPVRIRLAYHPLARKKEPLYQIVVAKSKTGRQRKPLEIVGVYDPIPRFPTTPNGQILSDQDKIKKISMNVDRVKYWLSVGAQPTDHCARLLAKAELIPPKPRFPDRSKPPIQTKITNWGFPHQGPERPSLSFPQSSSSTRENVLPSVIAPSGERLEREAREVSQSLVSSVLAESRYNSHSIQPGNVPLETKYITATPEAFTEQFRHWISCLPRPIRPGIKTLRERLGWGKNVKDCSTFALRAFMAYFRCSTHDHRQVGVPLYNLLKEWINQPQEQLELLKGDELFEVLKAMFEMWERCANELEVKGVWGRDQKAIAEDIRQRVRLLNIAATNREVKDQELKGWVEFWMLQKLHAAGTATEAQRRVDIKKETARSRTDSTIPSSTGTSEASA